jgi:hypothetical protein
MLLVSLTRYAWNKGLERVSYDRSIQEPLYLDERSEETPSTSYTSL